LLSNANLTFGFFGMGLKHQAGVLCRIQFFAEMIHDLLGSDSAIPGCLFLHTPKKQKVDT